MARFYPLYVRRSDGKLIVVAKGKRRERNEPSEEQLDQKPDRHGVSDFYREVGPDEMKHLDWRRKLGGMLAKELDWKNNNGQDNGYILATFPEHYRLYEHVKKTEKDGKTEVKSKTHAASGNDRQDAYLYGHPAGRRKRYRSPADFFPHLLWLCTDETGDPDDCGCKICSPEDLEIAIPGAKPRMERPVKQKSETKTAVAQTGAPIARQQSGQTVKVRQEPGQSTSWPPIIARQLLPAPLPQRKTHDHQIDSQYGSFMYRPGEVVWFQRGQSWGLGAVLHRWVTALSQYQYTVQPLSYPYDLSHPTTKASHVGMRPWLAWSVPRFTNEGLNNMVEPPTYESADWQAILQKRYGNGHMEVDGSILAAKAVDSTYTLISNGTTVEVEPGVTDIYHDAMFLGAEKIWTGDPVRLHLGTGTDVMVVHAIVERKRVSSTSRQVSEQTARLVGDVYTITVVSHADPSAPTPASPNNNPLLPQRLTEDLAFRNAKSIPAKHTASYWRLTVSQASLDLKDVKGRWYEASLLMPILQPAQFEDSACKGEIQEASLWMNARGDCVNSNRDASLPRLPKQINRKASRREAFGRAMPAAAEVRDGTEPPLPDNVDPALEQRSGPGDDIIEIDPHFDTAETEELSTLPQEPGGGLDEFMDLDGMDEHSQLPGFGQTYGSQTSESGQHY